MDQPRAILGAVATSQLRVVDALIVEVQLQVSSSHLISGLIEDSLEQMVCYEKMMKKKDKKASITKPPNMRMVENGQNHGGSLATGGLHGSGKNLLAMGDTGPETLKIISGTMMCQRRRRLRQIVSFLILWWHGCFFSDQDWMAPRKLPSLPTSRISSPPNE